MAHDNAPEQTVQETEDSPPVRDEYHKWTNTALPYFRPNAEERQRYNQEAVNLLRRLSAGRPTDPKFFDLSRPKSIEKLAAHMVVIIPRLDLTAPAPRTAPTSTVFLTRPRLASHSERCPSSVAPTAFKAGRLYFCPRRDLCCGISHHRQVYHFLSSKPAPTPKQFEHNPTVPELHHWHSAVGKNICAREAALPFLGGAERLDGGLVRPTTAS